MELTKLHDATRTNLTCNKLVLVKEPTRSIKMELTKMFNQNGKQLLVLDNFKFKFKYYSKISSYSTWICSKKTCNAKLVLNDENDT
jgi:hypothetical protein